MDKVPLVIPNGGLVGRGRELQRILDVLASGPDSTGVLLVGAAGVGKTRLAREALTRLEGSGSATVWVVGTAAVAEVPFGAMAALLGGLPAEPDRATFLHAAVQRLLARAAGGRLVLGVDDVHLLDVASKALVQQAGLQPEVSLLLTARTGEPRSASLDDLLHDDALTWVDVAPLGREDCRDMVSGLLGGEAEPELQDQVWERTQGNPFFVRELLLASRQSLQKRQSGWSWMSPPPVSTRVAEHVASRLHALDADATLVAEVLAVGEPLALALVESAGGPTGVVTADRAGLLGIESDGVRSVVRFAHPMYAEVLRGSLGASVGRDRRRRLAEALGTTPMRRRDDLVRMLTWALDGGLSPPAEQLVAGSGQAAAVYDLPLAERLARAAVAGGGGEPAGTALGTALAGQGRAEEAEEWLARAVPDGPDQRIIGYAITRSYNLFFALRRPEEAGRVLAEATRRAADPAAQDELTANRAWFLMLAGDCHSAFDAVQPLLQRPVVAWGTTAGAFQVALPALALAGRSADIDQLAGAAQRTLSALDSTPSVKRVQVEFPRFSAYLFAGRLADAAQVLQTEQQLAEEGAWDNAQAGWAAAAGDLAIARGQLASAVRFLGTSVDILRAATDTFGYLGQALTDLALAHLWSGRIAVAEELMVEVDSPGVAGMPYWWVWRDRARGWLLATTSRREDGAHHLVASAARAVDRGQEAIAVSLLHDAARLGLGADVVPSLTELVAEMQGPIFPLYVADAAARAVDDADALEAAAKGFAELGAHLLAADSAVVAEGIFTGSTGRTSDAVRVGALARRSLAACEDVRLLGGRPSGPLSRLSDREAQIVNLAADGRTSRDIAAQLVISVRTVDNHLARAYAKLSVSGRDELAALLRPETHR